MHKFKKCDVCGERDETIISAYDLLLCEVCLKDRDNEYLDKYGYCDGLNHYKEKDGILVYIGECDK